MKKNTSGKAVRSRQSYPLDLLADWLELFISKIPFFISWGEEHDLLSTWLGEVAGLSRGSPRESGHFPRAVLASRAII